MNFTLYLRICASRPQVIKQAAIKFVSSQRLNSSSLRLNMSTEAGPATYSPKYIDIGINLADPIFRGVYHGKSYHDDDLEDVIQRADVVGCKRFVVTGSDFKSCRDALELTTQFAGTVFSTVGIHPCSSSIFTTARAKKDAADGSDPDPMAPMSEDVQPDPQKTKQIISDLSDLISNATSSTASKGLVAFGEFGLDYDRLHYCSKTLQLHSFAAQLDLAVSLSPQLPLFLHSRAAHRDFVGLLKAKFGENLEKLEKGGVVHSFTGTAEEMQELMDLGLHIGINGCSFKTAENCAVVKEVRLDRLMLETDGPWCEIRPSHEGWKYIVEAKPPGDGAPGSAAESSTKPEQSSGKRSKKQQPKAAEVVERWPVVKKEKWTKGALVKGRNEPCMIEKVGKVVAGIKGVSVEEVCEAAWANTTRVFELGQ